MHITDPNFLKAMEEMEGVKNTHRGRTPLEEYCVSTFGDGHYHRCSPETAGKAGCTICPVHAQEYWNKGHRPREWSSWVIYGLGGFNRYYVQANGNVRFSEFHSSKDHQERAAALGFEVS